MVSSPWAQFPHLCLEVLCCLFSKGSFHLRNSGPPSSPAQPPLFCPSCWYGHMALQTCWQLDCRVSGLCHCLEHMLSGASVRKDSSGHPVSDVECPNSVNCFNPVLVLPSLQDLGSGRGAQSGGASRGTVTEDWKA